MIIAFTGHRPSKLGGWQPNSIQANLKRKLGSIINELGPDKAITGMALGVDQWAAWACIAAQVPFLAAIPFAGQESAWPFLAKRDYWSLLSHAVEIKYVCDPGYAAWKMQKRNEWLVDNCDILIAFWNGSRGGTANCVEYAELQSRPIIRINPMES